MVPLSQARQLDAQCMRWLSRQPGVTVADKAGGRQRFIGCGVRLELRRDAQSGALIPRRRCYKEGLTQYYPRVNALKKITVPPSWRGAGNPAEELQFIRHAYGMSNGVVALRCGNGEWRSVRNFGGLKFMPVQLPRIESRMIIASGPVDVASNAGQCIISDAKEDFIACGAARFAVRKANHLPTYFDQCEALSIIVQDGEKERVFAQELIPAQDCCPGGEAIIGQDNTDCFLESQNSTGRFYLAMGEVKGFTPLKVLVQDFGREARQRQQLIMKPSMIPGQGVAQVSIEGRPLFDAPVQLDFLEMRTSKDTLGSLQSKLMRSFPPDLPAVEASKKLWDEVELEVDGYLEKGRWISGDLFAKKRRQYQLASGLEAFKCINVFGNAAGKGFPEGVPRKRLDRLFARLANDYDRACRGLGSQEAHELLRLIAWSYQPEFGPFREIVKKAVCELYNAVHGGALGGNAVMHTVCANLLSDPWDVEMYFYAWMIHAENLLGPQSREVLKRSNWNRSLSQLLIYNNEALQPVKTENCTKIVEMLCGMLDMKATSPSAYRQVLVAMLFMLKRRKYDRGFLKDRGDIMAVDDSLLRFRQRHSADGENCDFCKAISKFLNGAGTLEGLPATLVDD